MPRTSRREQPLSSIQRLTHLPPLLSQFVQPLVIPIIFTLSSFAGIAVTSAGIRLYGEVLWNPLLLIDRWDSRAAAFFASLTFMIATIGTNISANSLSAGNDMTVLLPKVSNSALVAVLPQVILTSMVVHQYPTGSDHLRIHRRMGTLSMGHIGEVH